MKSNKVVLKHRFNQRRGNEGTKVAWLRAGQREGQSIAGKQAGRSSVGIREGFVIVKTMQLIC
jgi:hypothetical protein